ncbi:hypothetical protein MMAG44476_05676 [Mycolicibacterium mageritense DSM 44476 = CIP 104973]|uniref:DUF3500 domain-containing protein n=1 Tax=Mycolicibacterium mageritense TaxID=53462 RepID=A0ABM8HP17_MYCME|nr:DUF3500 domain-containing protein [Mycolicibacterium mageritense]MCC9186552.1 DUF3500 domain-containing protein [Mycolicibacterium mageritense]BBX38185.1 hypothetical protein MMAGJ_74670 [Mycolicibacterium mageritense]CDO27081.1 hypothetical protein BN978_07646 [Mycolicibacterium mageritense DSM 44476 = CIP 104973]
MTFDTFTFRPPRTAAEVSALDATRPLAVELAEKVADWLDSLSSEQRTRATFAPPGKSENERLLWFYTPTDHGGLPLVDQRPAQHRLAMQILAAGLSEAGYVTLVTVMGMENVLDRLEGWSMTFERERGRDPGMYYVSVFGSPGDRLWGWRFGGHHVSVNQLIADGCVVSTTPLFLGADPAAAPLIGGVLQPLASVQDVALGLMRSFDRDQRTRALIHPRAVSDLVGANRSLVSEGNQRLPLPDVFRGRFTDSQVARQLDQVNEAMQSGSGYSAEDDAQVALTGVPKGLPAAAMTAKQRDALRILLDLYFTRAAEPIAESYRVRYQADDQLDALHVAWAGAVKAGEPHYYRIQGPGILIEYDNTQRRANHVHAVWRDPTGDFGVDTLAHHHHTAHGALTARRRNEVPNR